MLKGIDPALTPDLLYTLSSMGHGDEIVVVDAHYPAEFAARRSALGKLVRFDAGDSARAIRAILSVMELDSFVPHPAERMEVDDQPDFLPNVQLEAQQEVERASGGSSPFGTIPRQDFYQRAQKAFCVVITAETRGWGCFIFKKGLIVTPDQPSSNGNTSVGQWSGTP